MLIWHLCDYCAKLHVEVLWAYWHMSGITVAQGLLSAHLSPYYHTHMCFRGAHQRIPGCRRRGSSGILYRECRGTRRCQIAQGAGDGGPSNIQVGQKGQQAAYALPGWLTCPYCWSLFIVRKFLGYKT